MPRMFLIFILLPFFSSGQDTLTKVDPKTGKVETFISVDHLAEAPYDAVKYIADHIKYPVKTADTTLHFRVVVLFTINVDGTITNAKVVKSSDSTLDNEAIRVINSMPKWLPATADGKPVPCNYSMPVIMQY